ncbi:MAG TPA: PilZ domain-containing protein [Candidatus Xenobia bacterium]|jgi:c-di-GMP-binding flagellar brake protein YcgR
MEDIRSGFTALFQATEGQNRRVTRLRCTYPVQCVAPDDTFDAQVCDMSTGGMRLELPHRLKPGTTIGILYASAADLDTAQAEVMWCRKQRGADAYQAGVRYADPDHVLARSWVKLILGELGFDVARLVDRRKSMRINVSGAQVAARMAAGRLPLDGSIVNLGAAGCLMEVRRHVLPGTIMQVHLGPQGGLPVLHLMGRVVRMAKKPERGRWQLTIQFEAMSGAQVEALGRYLLLVLGRASA